MGTLAAGKPFAFTIAPDPGQGGVVPVGLRMWFSGDRGGHWSEATVVPGPDHTFQAVLTNPALTQSVSDTVSLKARARDDAGNAMEQIITDAYLLR
ncbi:MAG TPA: hypothetical protein VFY84_19115, partial [Jiangellales bacterium]|nr:hypothetical protein [Jiangellales bacterium]